MKKIKIAMMGTIGITCFSLIMLITLHQINGMFIISTNPEKIIAAQSFNEVDNQSTMGITGKGFDEQSTIYINDIPQPTTFGSSQFLTCFVDRELYEEETTLKIQVKGNDRVSNKYKIKVYK